MSIGIVGAGISGLHLALRLRQLGLPATLYAPQEPDDIRGGPPLNFVTRLASTRAREQTLGITEWASSRYDNPWMHLHLENAEGLSFRAELPAPASSVDFRMYLASLLEEYERRGGDVAHRSVTDADQLAGLAARHELLVVAAGRTALTDVFGRDDSRSPWRSAPRHLVGGLFHGVRRPEPAGMTMHMVPGAGEIHAPTYHSFDGQVTVLLVEAVPDGPLSAVTDTDYQDDPVRLASDVLKLVTAHTPALRERVDEADFALTRPQDVLRGALTPVVRRGWARVTDDRFALAIGDAWIVNDPLTAQGANLGSRQAFELADLLVARESTSGKYDEQFCAEASEHLWSFAGPVVDWTNMFLGPPPPQVQTLLGAAAADQRIADAFVANLDRPAAMWQSIAHSGNTERFLAEHGSPGGQR